LQRYRNHQKSYDKSTLSLWSKQVWLLSPIDFSCETIVNNPRSFGCTIPSIIQIMNPESTA
jgi:hypothetical protein